MRKSLLIVPVLLLLLFAAIGAPVALADTIENFTTPLGGTLTVDVTNGTITAVDIPAPGFADFTTGGGLISGCTELGLVQCDGWFIEVGNTGNFLGAVVDLTFTTNPTPGSLVGFTGGSVIAEKVYDVGGGLVEFVYGGTISPAASVPEPPTVWLTLIGVGLVSVMRKRVGQGLSTAT
jgi:hypothetical protein